MTTSVYDRWGLLGGLFLLLTLTAVGCNGKLSEEECDKLRTDGFDVLNRAHPCNSDEDCVGSEWPGCMKPVSSKNAADLQPLSEKFKKGKCEEPKRKCPDPPEVYCKQGLCVFRHRPPEG